MLDDSPATEAGIRVGDVVAGVDGQPAEGLPLTMINEKFEVPGSYELAIRRGTTTLSVTLKPRPLI